MEKPKVSLINQDGNAFNVLGIVSKALRDAGYSKDQIRNYTQEAMQGNYDNLINVTMKWVEIV